MCSTNLLDVDVSVMRLVVLCSRLTVPGVAVALTVLHRFGSQKYDRKTRRENVTHWTRHPVNRSCGVRVMVLRRR